MNYSRNPNVEVERNQKSVDPMTRTVAITSGP